MTMILNGFASPSSATTCEWMLVDFAIASVGVLKALK